ncbi:ABC transporter permease, partial [Candidatus Parcubacteria bacterium]
YLGAFYVLSTIVLHRGGEGAVSFLLVGLVVWKWFMQAIPQCGSSILINAGLIKQVYLPKWVLPASALCTNTIKFFILFAILLLYLILVGHGITIKWLSLPILMMIQFVTMVAIGGVLAAITPFFPDLRLIVGNSLLLLFFLSGIFFDIDSVESDMKEFLYLNPMAGIIIAYRDVLLRAEWPDWNMLGMIASVSLMGGWVAWRLLDKYDRVYAKVI